MQTLQYTSVLSPSVILLTLLIFGHTAQCHHMSSLSATLLVSVTALSSAHSAELQQVLKGRTSNSAPWKKLSACPPCFPPLLCHHPLADIVMPVFFLHAVLTSPAATRTTTFCLHAIIYFNRIALVSSCNSKTVQVKHLQEVRIADVCTYTEIYVVLHGCPKNILQ